MTDRHSGWRRPPIALLACVMLAHVLLLWWQAPTTPPSARPTAWAVQLRVIDAPTAMAPATALPGPAYIPPEAAARPVRHARPHATQHAAPTRPAVRKAQAQEAAPHDPPAAPQRATAAAVVAQRAIERTDDHRVAPAAADDAAPPPVRLAPSARLRYQVHGTARGQAFDTEAQLDWLRDGDRYQAEWSVQLASAGPRRQRSEGAINASGLAPERYGEQARAERAAHFDPAGGRIRFSANTPDATLSAGFQDRLSASLQLGGMLAAAPHRYPPGSAIVLPTAGVRDAEPWRWEVLPDETLQVDGQDVPCAVLVRHPRRDYDTRIELWLARTHAYLPARLRTTLFNGDTLDQQLAALPPG